jgi:hypothetical protein
MGCDTCDVLGRLADAHKASSHAARDGLVAILEAARRKGDAEIAKLAEDTFTAMVRAPSIEAAAGGRAQRTP